MPTTPRIPQGILRRRPWSANDRKIQEGRPSCETQRDVDQGGAASVRIWIGDDGLDSRDGEYERLRCLQMSEEKQGGACNTDGRRDMAKSSDHEEDVDI